MKNEKGFSLIEVIISLALLGIIGVGFLSGLATAYKSLFIAGKQTTAESLARSQLEYIKGQNYDDANNPPQYILLSDIPENYNIIVTATRLDPDGDGTGDDDGIQRITVVISHETNKVITLEDHKVNL